MHGGADGAGGNRVLFDGFDANAVGEFEGVLLGFTQVGDLTDGGGEGGGNP